MSHNDYVDQLPEGFVSVAHTDDCPVAAMQNVERRLYGMQYHPEVSGIPKTVCKCFITSFIGSVALRETGRWRTMLGLL